MPAQPSSSVPDGTLFTSFQRRFLAVSAFGQQSPTVRITLPAQHVYGRRAFSVSGPTVWNSLPEDLRDPECCADSYRQSLKTFLFSQYSVFSVLEVFYVNALVQKFTFDIWHYINIQTSNHVPQWVMLMSTHSVSSNLTICERDTAQQQWHMVDRTTGRSLLLGQYVKYRQCDVGRDSATDALMTCDAARSLVRSTSENCISQRPPIDRRLHGSPEIIINYRSEVRRLRLPALSSIALITRLSGRDEIAADNTCQASPILCSI